MKKSLFYIFAFISVFFFVCVSKIEAKSASDSNIVVNFGEGDILNLNYVSNNTFKIEDDKSFYFNGVKYKFNSDYTFINDTISVNNNAFSINEESFTIDLENNQVVSENMYESYNFPVSIEFESDNKTIYEFKQTLCYKYDSVEECNIDTGDIVDVSISTDYNFYYGFLPFYNENIQFEYLTYKFSLSNEDITINFDDITFTKDEINYQDYFTIGSYGDNYNSTYNDKNYVMPFAYNNTTLYIYGFFLPGYATLENRIYTINFEVCVGNNYDLCVSVFNSNGQPSYQGIYYELPLTNITYNYNEKTVDYTSFKLKGSYVCYSNCDDSRSQKELTYANEEIYYLNLKNPTYQGELNGKEVSCNYYYTCYGSNGIITNKVSFIDDNEILEIYYLVSEQSIVDNNLINNKIENNSSITIGEGLEGSYYLYFKVLDSSGKINRYSYQYLFDKTGPSISEDNFDDYSSEGMYNEVILMVNYADNLFGGAYKIFYKVVKESEYLTVSKEDIINDNNEYSDQIDLHSLVSKDGMYRVCFVGMDYLDNYGNKECSNSYYIDISKLTKDEVNVSSNNLTYEKKVSLHILISGVSDDVSFKCGFILKTITITSSNDLSNNCLNNKDSILTIENSEGRYNLWIYASDVAGNFALLKLDRVYFLDNKAPVVSYEINGDNSVYSNNVNLDVDVKDLNNIDTNSLSYMFYISTYNENNFENFDLNLGISYPYDYYGSYKVAIKACDILSNCNITTFDDTFLIDTGKITLELIGEEEITILRWGKYKELGARATKGNNGKYISEVSYQVSADIDTNNIGIYYVTYTSGEGINKTSITRKVVVKDSVPYIIGIACLIVIGEAIILLRLFVKKRKNDTI